MIVNLKELDNILRKFVENHAQLKEYLSADIIQLVSDDRTYPLMWAQFTNPAVFSTQMVNPVITVMILDRLMGDNSNALDVQNDTLLMMDDLYMYLNENYDEFLFFEDDDATAEPIMVGHSDSLETNDDRAAGYAMDITFKIGNSRNELQIPRE